MPMITASTSTLTPEETTLPSTRSARNAVLPKRPKGISTKPSERCQLELDQGDEELHREDEEGEQHHGPGEHQHDDLDEILEEADIAHQVRDRGQNGPPGIEPNLGHAPGAHQIGGAEPGATGLQTEPGEALKNNACERVPVRNDVGEGTHKEGFLDQTREDVVIRAPGPEEGGQRDVDDDQRGGEEGNFATQQAEPAVDVAGEDLKEAVDDAGATHWFTPPGLRMVPGSGTGGGSRSRWRRSLDRPKRRLQGPGSAAALPAADHSPRTVRGWLGDQCHPHERSPAMRRGPL